MASSAERKLTTAQGQIARAKAQIAKLDKTIDRRANPKKFGLDTRSRSSSGLQRQRQALLFNINVFQGRAATAFQEVVRQKTLQAQAKIKAQKLQVEKQRKAEVARQKQIVADRKAKLVADSQAQKQRDRDAEARKKQKEIEKAQAVFQSEDIQQEVKPSLSGEESFISNLEQVRRDRLEKLEATKSIPRLEEGTTFFGTGAGFEPVDIESGKGAGASRTEGTAFTVSPGGKVTEKPIKNILSPESSEGAFIDTQIQAQLATNVESLLQTEKVLTAVQTGKASKAQAVFEQTVTPELAEAGTRGGSTVLGEADEFGVAINRPSQGIPAISGQLIGEVDAPGDFADFVNEQGQGTAFKVKKGKVTSEPIPPVDKFEVAKSEIESTGLISGEPISFGNLLGFDTPPKTKKEKSQVFPSSFGSGGLSVIEQPQDTIKSITDAGLLPTEKPITSGFIPFDQPISGISKSKKGKSTFFAEATPLPPALPLGVEIPDKKLKPRGAQVPIGQRDPFSPNALFVPALQTIEGGLSALTLGQDINLPFQAPIRTPGKIGEPDRFGPFVFEQRTVPTSKTVIPDPLPSLFIVSSSPKARASIFEGFVFGLGKEFGFDVGGDFFKSISRSISFERSTSKEKIGKKSLTKFRAEQAKIELSKKQKRAKAAGFSVGSKGKVFKFGKVNGRTVILAEGKTVKGLQSSIRAKNKAKADFARKKAAIQRQVAALKASKRRRSIARAKSRAKRKVQKSRARPLGKVSGTSKPRKVVKVSKPSARKRGTDRSSLFISGLTSSPGTDRFGGGPSGSKKKSKKGKSTPGIFGGGFGSGRRF